MTRDQLDAIRARVESGHRHQGCCAVEARENLRALLAEVERLTTERDAAFRRGVATMREAAAHSIDCPATDCPCNGEKFATYIRALPDPEDK